MWTDPFAATTVVGRHDTRTCIQLSRVHHLFGSVCAPIHGSPRQIIFPLVWCWTAQAIVSPTKTKKNVVLFCSKFPRSRTEFESFVRDDFYLEEHVGRTSLDVKMWIVNSTWWKVFLCIRQFRDLRWVSKSDPYDGVQGERDQKVRARFVERQFVNSLDANFCNPTPGLEVTRVLSSMTLSKDLTILSGDICVASPMSEDDPENVESLEVLYEYNDTIRFLKRALTDLRDVSRLFNERVAVLTSRLDFARSEVQSTLFVDLTRSVFIAVHVDDLIMIGSSSQLYEVVGEMKQCFVMKVKQCFVMKVTHPLSISSIQTYVGARYFRHDDVSWELSTARYVTGMPNEHDMQNAKPVVTPAVNRWTRVSSGHRDSQKLLSSRTRSRTSLRRSVSCDICEERRISNWNCKCKTERAQLWQCSPTLTGDRPTRKSVSLW